MPPQPVRVWGLLHAALADGEAEREKLPSVDESSFAHSSGRTRTYNPPVNSRLLCQLSYDTTYSMYSPESPLHIVC